VSRPLTPAKRMAGTKGLEPATSAVTVPAAIIAATSRSKRCSDSERRPHSSEGWGTLHVDETRVYVISRPEVDMGLQE
jgi:hypothetical protein